MNTVIQRTRTGCFTCRKRRKKCDEARPDCKACVRNKRQCLWPKDSGKSAVLGPTGDYRIKSTGTCPVGDRSMTTLAQSPSPIPTAARRTPLSPLLLQSYLRNTSPLLVVKPAHLNGFLTMVLPTAYLDDCLMDALLAMSGQHLRGIVASHSDIYRTTGHHYGVAIQGVQRRIRTLSNLPAGAILDLVLVLLVLCHAEVLSNLLRDLSWRLTVYRLSQASKVGPCSTISVPVNNCFCACSSNPMESAVMELDAY